MAFAVGVFVVGVSGVACGECVGWMWTGSGLFLGWAVALGSKFIRMEGRIRFWGSFPASIPLPSSVSIRGFFSHGQTVAPISEDSNNSCFVDTAPPPWCHLGTLPLDSLPLDEHVDWQALKLISTGCQIFDQFHFAGCQIFYQFHFEAHLLFGSKSSPQYDFFNSIGH